MRCLIFLGIAALGGAWTAFRGIRASDQELRAMAGVIGTRSPTLARVVCWGAFVPLLLIGGGIVGSYVIFGIRVALGGEEGGIFDDFLVAIGCSAALALATLVYAIACPPNSDPAPIRGQSPEEAEETEEDDGSIRFPCQECASWLRVAPGKAGGEVRCPACEQQTRVPARSIPRPSAPPETERGSADPTS
jgi:hypothetical protein